jgi:sensor c-di-GMP phosphodiesterase-like protein
MPYLAKLFIGGRHSAKVLFLTWAAVFLALIAVAYKIALWNIAADLQRQNQAALTRLTQTHDFAVSALQSLQQTATASPCSEDFLRQMQVIAYRPDGLNLFFYAPARIPKCGTNHVSYPAAPALGEPAVQGDTDEPDLWISEDLRVLGMPGVSGTIAMLAGFGVVIPPFSLIDVGTEALNSEVVIRGSDGKIWPLSGKPGLFQRLSPTTNQLGLASNVVQVSCGPRNVYCIASEKSLSSWIASRRPMLALAAIVGAAFAWVCAYTFVHWLTRFWSFEARFARNLDERSIVLVYQPIIDLQTDRVSGCEVLARWRDLDGSIVSPVRFIGLVRRSGRTLEFTRLVVNRAFDELTRHAPEAQLRINFNLFACDFQTSTVLTLFDNFTRAAHRFGLAVELVEDEQIDYDKAQITIGDLRKFGIKTYIDDFGTGYSSIERVATLGADGVKLDRSFAMSSPDSVLGRMFEQVLRLVQASGNSVVVEGVDTESRLELLRQTGLVRYVQGYVISRPIEITEFARFLALRNSVPEPAMPG